MGVHGLWRLIEPSGKPVPLETLENKVLAVDISIWIHQAVKGFQDARGGAVPNAHLLGIYHRICKLLYFKIKPVFVFDGGVPVLKKQTIAKRTQSKLRDLSKADHIQRQLLNTLLKHTAVSKVIAEKIEASIGLPKAGTRPKKDDIYVLPPSSELDSTMSSSDEESYSEDTTSESSPTKQWDVHNIDMNSLHFKSLPVDVRHEILTDLKETRKQSSWGRLHELPKVSDDFSVFQMKRLLKRQAVQTALEDAEKEMGGKSLSLAELESILKDQGVLAHQNLGNRIASDETTKYLLVKDVKKAIEEARQKEDEESKQSNSSSNVIPDNVQARECEEFIDSYSGDLPKAAQTKADAEYEDDLQRAIALSLECTSTTPERHKEVTAAENVSFLDNFAHADFASSSSDEEARTEETSSKMSSAHSYMREYSGLTPSEISKILASNAQSTSVKAKISKDLQLSLPTVLEKTPTEENGKCEDSVEIMSTSDSDDSELDSKQECAKVLDVFIDPTTSFKEDEDLFADVFAAAPTIKESIISIPDGNLEGKSLNTSVNVPHSYGNEIAKAISPPPAVESEENDKVMEAEASNAENQTDNSSLSSNRKSLPQDGYIKQPPATQDHSKAKPSAMTEQELKTLKDQLQVDKVNLINEKSSRERMAGNITDQMYQEAQELLELFGVPYVVAPMEAEAQCAFLDSVELIDGTITDDSDIWLFGGKTVYKNFFNQNKYVMEFQVENIQHHFKLSREQMILLALLVGSDYTVGLQGVGPVTAMEILAAFPPSKGKTMTQQDLLSGLKEFRSWFTKGKSSGPGRSSLKSKLKNLAFTENFPSLQVVQAYLDPKVENSKESFSWGRPNAMALIEYARDKFGWTKTKAQDILNPVLKQLEDSKHQKSIRDYFRTQFKIHSGDAEDKMSKRVKTAINNMGKDPEEIIKQELEEELRKNIGSKKREPRKRLNRKAPEFSSKTADKNLETKLESTRSTKVNLKKLKSTSTEPEETTQQAHEANSPNKAETEDTTQQNRESKKPKTKRASLKKLKSTPTDPSLDMPCTSGPEQKDEEPATNETITEKINRVRRRRKLLELKAATEIKKPKVVKEKRLVNAGMEADEEIDLLNKVLKESRERVEEINQGLRERLEKITKYTTEVAVPGPSNAPSNARRPANRPTRVPKKESIPQKEKDKATVLRNKLKAIEVFRKGKQGPGFIPKWNQKKRSPKTQAELSESSDE